MNNNLPNEGIKIETEITLDIERLKDFIANGEHKYLTAHKKICFAIIKRIYTRVIKGHRFGAIKISDNELIIDGNHRYIAYKLAHVEFQIIEGTRSFCDQSRSFNEIEIDIKEDWDFNNPKNKKYCNDDFLSNEDYNK